MDNKGDFSRNPRDPFTTGDNVQYIAHLWARTKLPTAGLASDITFLLKLQETQLSSAPELYAS